MLRYALRLLCLMPLAVVACQSHQDSGAAGRKSRPADDPIESGALFYWVGASATQTFGHYTQGQPKFTVDSVNHRNYSVRIFDQCLTVDARDTVLATCNDASPGTAAFAPLLAKNTRLHFTYSGESGEHEQVLVYEVADLEHASKQSLALPRRAVILDLKPFSSDGE
ncbi:hypothetical protein [Hymenobacter properus]|uniref:Lipoprotein n=1 Tax=Hymenobacter properus TaxID=2791026 RepID=A0A931FJW1_9BACT|nr:hypothetical protein [Hymenobacter properus]MBF9141000.1 hypothetical protein [Hymenobacter properus]